MIRGSKGKFFKVQFTKKDGTPRTLNGRLGVKKGIKGTGLAFNPNDYGLMTAYDVKSHGYRMINLSTVFYFKCGAVEWRKAA